MSIMLAIIDRLTSAGAADGRIFVQRAPQGAPTPYIVLTKTSGDEGLHLGGATDGLARNTVDCDCHGATHAEAEATAEAVRAALHGWRDKAGPAGARRDIRHCRMEGDADDAFRERGEASDRWTHRCTRSFILFHSAATS
jgi:hypothetical protein